jgi:hypothetical protein
MKSGRALVTVVVVILLSLTAIYWVMDNYNSNQISNPFQQYYIPQSINMSFARNFTFSSPSNGQGYYFFYITIPQNSSLQNGNVKILHSKNMTETISNEYGREFITMKIYPGEAYANFTYNFKTYGQNWQNIISESGNVSQIPSYLKQEYDHAEYFNITGSNKSYEVIDPSYFRNMTINITKNDTTVASKLRAIYNFIVQNFKYNITYNLGNIPLTAEQVYNDRIGDCEELSYLFESMSRSIGIPSWTQYGLLIQQQGGGISIGQHAWIQTYVPLLNGSGEFVNIDLTVEVGGQDLGRGFFVKYPNSLTEWTDNGNSTDMVAYHEFLMYPSFGLGTISTNETDYVFNFSQQGIININTTSFSMILQEDDRK